MSAKKLDEQTVRAIAKLAAIEVSDSEVHQFGSDLNSILEYIEVMNEVDVAKIEPTSHVHGINNAFRDDVLIDSLNREKALSSAPQTIGSSFKVPRVIKQA